jgi:ABC-2 type transport system permease protein
MGIKKYPLVWWTMAQLSIQSTLENRMAAVLFMTAKLFRFGLFLVFLSLLHRSIQSVSGYTFDQLVTFFLVFNLFDMFGQFFFRGIYWFREQVVSGELDFKLIKPMNVLFQVLTRQTDILDLPVFLVVLAYLARQGFSLTPIQLATTFLVIIGALLIITAVHIVVAGLGVVTTEVDHTIMIFRDLSAMARMPVDIYTPLVRSLLTFVIPIALAYTFPAKALLGLLSISSGFLCLGAGILSLIIALLFWNRAVKEYSSASS